eukprot:TRINITY_DN50857_c0_g1_i1.p2 TRINITY_DN50857_c0_g1~~TRINITY_DN50857_c0_g1_i1.p2  ORF type:complete len:147 (-),score=9.25 TRINITY_DN50857_c0_g1_i1:14-454(-)
MPTCVLFVLLSFFFQAEDGIRDFCLSRGLGDVYKRQTNYMPSPVDIWNINGTDPKTEKQISRHCGDDEPFAALVFKIMNDPYVGKLSFFRVYSGTAEKGAGVYNPRTRNRERLGRCLLYTSDADDEEDRVVLCGWRVMKKKNIKMI